MVNFLRVAAKKPERTEAGIELGSTRITTGQVVEHIYAVGPKHYALDHLGY